MHLLIIRHGECLGQSDPNYYDDPDSALSPRGEQQARHIAQRLRKEHVTHIMSSPLIRSLATASMIAETIKIEHIDVWLELREGWDDLHRGLARGELQRRFPRAVFPQTMTENGWEHGGDVSYALFFARAEQVLQQIKQQFSPDDRVAIVTHGGFANYLLHALLHIAPTIDRCIDV